MLTLQANLEPTGSGLDQTRFVTFDTAYEIARISATPAIATFEIPADMISAVFIRMAPGCDPKTVAADNLRLVHDLTPIKSPDIFQAYRRQKSGILQSLLGILGITWALVLVFINLVFSMAASERRRELGVLRAIGANRGFIERVFISEAGILALVEAFAGIVLAVVGISIFHEPLTLALGLPYIFPALPVLLAQITIGLGVTLLAVALAAYIPAYRISHQDPAVATRE